MKKWSEVFSKEFTLSQYLYTLYIHAPLFEEIVGEKPSSVLEVGTGSGSMSIFLSHLGYNVTAIDNDENVLNHARELCAKVRGNVEFILCDAFELSRKFKWNEFDVVFSQGLLEHFSDDQIKELLSQQLYVGRIALFSVPSEFFPESWKATGDERLMGIREWLRIIEKVDYDMEFRAKYYRTEVISLRAMMRNVLKNPVLIVNLLKRPRFILNPLKSLREAYPLEILVKLRKETKPRVR